MNEHLRLAEREVALRPNYQASAAGAECNSALLPSRLLRRRGLRRACTLAFLALVSPSFAADPPPKAPVPPSPWLPGIYRYADAMLQHGRDTCGPQKTGLFLSALDRTTLAPLTIRPPAPAGVREEDRAGPKDGPLTGANLQHDENLLRLLYTLSELSSKPVYRDAADGALKWFFQNAPSPLPWGTNLSWNVTTDEVTAKPKDAKPEFFRPWLLWDRCFEVAAEPTKQFALGLKSPAAVGMDHPRDAGFSIRTWAVAYAQTKDPQFLKAIEVALERFERKRHSKTGLIVSSTGSTDAWPASSLSLAIDCDGAAHRVPEPLASHLRAFAAREDEVFCALSHDLKTKGGFVSVINPDGGNTKVEFTPRWDTRYGANTSAQVALLCVSRYENTGGIAHRNLMLAAAEAYLNSSPPDDADTWPLAYGHAISLQVSAWRHTARPVHLEDARRLAAIAVEKFWGTSTLPRASLKSEHYESITGADTLALALVELHLNILAITAVRSPANTIDR